MNKHLIKTNWKSLLAIFFIVVMAFSFYALTLRGAPGNPTGSEFKNNLDQATKAFELSPERGRYTHLVALAEDNTYALSPELRDAAYPDVGYHEDKYYSFFAPGLPYLALPFYLFGAQYNMAQVFTFGFVAFMSILALIFLFKISRDILKLPVWASILAVLIFAFGSTAWSYAITFYQHHLTTFFILSSFYAVWKFKQQGFGSWMWAALVWLNFGLAVAIDYPNALLMMPVMIYLLISSVSIISKDNKTQASIRVSAVLTAVFLVIVTGLHFYHNTTYFGSWSQISSTIPGYKIDAVYEPAKEKSAVGFFDEENLAQGFNVLFFSADRGLFLYSPIFIFALLGIFYVIRKKISLEMGILLGSVGVNVFLYSSWGDPWGGWAYGPRYLIPSMAILAMFVALALNTIKYKYFSKIVAFILIAYSSAVALLGALTTNAVPPEWEAVGLGAKSNFMLNLDFFGRGESGSFMFNNYFVEYFTLLEYFLFLYVPLLLILFIVMFLLPKEEYEA